MRNFRILVDLDEVLADFVGGACKAHGLEQGAVLSSWPPGEWGMDRAMGLSPRNFWEPINRGDASFWAELPMLPHAMGLMDLVTAATEDWFIVSTPSHQPCSCSGKLFWLQRFFDNRDFDRYVFTKHKELLAGPNVILIDDSDNNCARFQRAGGHAILFPAHHNAHRRSHAEPVTYVRDRLLGIFRS